MYIKGMTEYDKNGKEIKTCCIFGKATKDGEVKEINGGKHVASVSVKAFSKQDGNAEFVTVKAWDGPFARMIGNTAKGDSMMACGRLAEREYNGKTYVDLMVDYYMCMPAGGGVATIADRVNTFNESNADDELPF